MGASTLRRCAVPLRSEPQDGPRRPSPVAGHRLRGFGIDPVDGWPPDGRKRELGQAVDGTSITKIAVGDGPRELCGWLQPGRYPLGHTGVTR